MPKRLQTNDDLPEYLHRRRQENETSDIGGRFYSCDTRCDMNRIKIVVEKHEDGYVAYPVGMRGVVVGEGDSYEEALADVKSAIRFHVESFGERAFAEESPVLEAFIAETELVDAEVSH